MVIVSDCRMCGGREFQSLGAVQLKARAPMVTRRGVGTVSRPAEGARGGVLLKKVNLLKKRNAVSLHPTQETSTGVL